MASERERLSQVTKFMPLPSVKWAADLCIKDGDRAARLYYIGTAVVYCITVVLSEEANVEVAMTDRGTLELYKDHPAYHRLVRSMEQCKPYVGAFQIERSRASRFFAKLDELAAATKQDCFVNSRDGLMCYHVVAGVGEDRCTEMIDPDLHPDPSFAALVNLYSTEFVGGQLNLKHQRTGLHDWVARFGRAKA